MIDTIRRRRDRRSRHARGAPPRSRSYADLLVEGTTGARRTSSWVEHGMRVESGFHRFRGIYRAPPALLRRAGIGVESP